MASARSVSFVRFIGTQACLLLLCMHTGGDRRRDNSRGHERSYQDSLPGTLPDGDGGYLEDERARYVRGARFFCFCLRKVDGFRCWCGHHNSSGDVSVVVYAGEKDRLPSIVQPVPQWVYLMFAFSQCASALLHFIPSALTTLHADASLY